MEHIIALPLELRKLCSSNMNKAQFIFVLSIHKKIDRNNLRADKRGTPNS